jgi:hypothetical protein
MAGMGHFLRRGHRSGRMISGFIGTQTLAR